MLPPPSPRHGRPGFRIPSIFRKLHIFNFVRAIFVSLGDIPPCESRHILPGLRIIGFVRAILRSWDAASVFSSMILASFAQFRGIRSSDRWEISTPAYSPPSPQVDLDHPTSKSGQACACLASFARFPSFDRVIVRNPHVRAFVVVIPGNPRSPHRQILPGLCKFGFVCGFSRSLWLTHLANCPQSRLILRIFGFVLSFQSLTTGAVSRRSRSSGRSRRAEHPCALLASRRMAHGTIGPR
jgi:hypothetical protein